MEAKRRLVKVVEVWDWVGLREIKRVWEAVISRWDYLA
jgi:hypothetical protein